jgi:hypothetical protein
LLFEISYLDTQHVLLVFGQQFVVHELIGDALFCRKGSAAGFDRVAISALIFAAAASGQRPRFVHAFCAETRGERGNRWCSGFVLFVHGGVFVFVHGRRRGRRWRRHKDEGLSILDRVYALQGCYANEQRRRPTNFSVSVLIPLAFHAGFSRSLLLLLLAYRHDDVVSFRFVSSRSNRVFNVGC